ncbi:MAG: PAS domain-containing protein, partial [Wenzhouxiangellaceae bacterium]
MLDDLQTAVLVLDAQSDLIFANAAAEELLGVGPAWRGQLAAALRHGVPNALLRRARASGSALSVREVDWPVGGRSLLLDFDLTPMTNGEMLIELR